jgi:medium-chain acyl-[acyl-carrier-protein] hydrolase
MLFDTCRFELFRLEVDLNKLNSWFCRLPGVSGNVRLFCFPFAGGNAGTYLPWQRGLGNEFEVCAVQLPGRSTRMLETAVRDMDSLVASLVEAINTLVNNQPFVFFGHSMGALLAFEVARALRRNRMPLPYCIFVSGAAGPQTRLTSHQYHELPDKDFLDVLRDYNGTPAELLENNEMMELILPTVRADFALVERYIYRPELPLDIPFHVLRGDCDPHVTEAAAAGWGLETNHTVQHHVFLGDHFFINDHQSLIETLLKNTLKVLPIVETECI